LENNRAKEVLPGNGGWRVGGCEVAQTMYMHVSKCKNNKIKIKVGYEGQEAQLLRKKLEN
jgi:hypothetical protein